MNIYLENDTFQDWMKAVQAKVEVSLTKHLPPAVVPLKLHEAMGYAVLDGGKRVRPLLVYAAGMLSINQDDPAHHEVLESAACAVEMIHAYSLVHDDMPCMDDDALRRGKPTVHKKYGEATALLVGDALQSQAFLVLSKANAPADRVLFMMQILTHASGSAGMCGGQAIDLDSVGLPLSITELEVMHLLKTGALVRASVFLGAVAGGFMRNNELKALDQYANAVGLAFQVIDDILDATSDSATLGKTAGKDAADNKPTYVSLLGLEGSLELAVKLQQMAHCSLRMFGDTAQLLHELADYIVQRKA